MRTREFLQKVLSDPDYKNMRDILFDLIGRGKIIGVIEDYVVLNETEDGYEVAFLHAFELFYHGNNDYPCVYTISKGNEEFISAEEIGELVERSVETLCHHCGNDSMTVFLWEEEGRIFYEERCQECSYEHSGSFCEGISLTEAIKYYKE